MPVAPSVFFFQQKNEILMAPLREKLARSQFQEKESMSEIKKPKMSKKFYYLKVPISTSRVSQTRTRLPQSVESICSLQILGTVLWIVTPKHGSIVDPSHLFPIVFLGTLQTPHDVTVHHGPKAPENRKAAELAEPKNRLWRIDGWS